MPRADAYRKSKRGFAGSRLRLAARAVVAGPAGSLQGRELAAAARTLPALVALRQQIALRQTLEERLGSSFRLVSERLEQVHRGLGEMQTLAAGVGDLKRVLANVKVRGTWGEVQLGALLEQALAPEQYAANVATREASGEHLKA